MCPCVNGNVILIDADCGLKLLRVQEDVLTNKEVGRALIVLGEELVQSIRGLGEKKKKKKKRAVNPRRQIMQKKTPNRQRTIVKAERNRASGGIPNITRSDTLVRRGADGGAIGIITRGIRRVLEISARGNGDVWYLASRNGIIQRIDPRPGHICSRGEVGGKARRPFCPNRVNTGIEQFNAKPTGRSYRSISNAIIVTCTPKEAIDRMVFFVVPSAWQAFTVSVGVTSMVDGCVCNSGREEESRGKPYGHD